jgi:hypothetical protein
VHHLQYCEDRAHSDDSDDGDDARSRTAYARKDARHQKQDGCLHMHFDDLLNHVSDGRAIDEAYEGSFGRKATGQK